jgi:sterol desaturase/sphingolipid hydroxylase (fatty acid hydroxylase superfamily)
MDIWILAAIGVLMVILMPVAAWLTKRDRDRRYSAARTMSGDVEPRPRQKKRSRTVIGFHRLGLVLAVPLFIAALVTAVFAWFSNGGRGFYWEGAAWAGGLAVFAIFIYIVARAVGWVIDGFVSKPEG